MIEHHCKAARVQMKGERAATWSPGGMLEPGRWVRHPQQPDWGEGQVQSVIGSRVTVNFEHAGKILINTAKITLDTLDE
jgi:hypothetical protein